MTWWDAAFLAVAGFAGGLTGSIAGLASVATYPALLVLGLPPVTANVTNTVALIFNGIGSAWGSRPELGDQLAWLKRILPAATVGGAAAGVLLLALLLRAGEATLPHANAGKNVILGVANSVAAVTFAVLAPVYWPAVVPLGIGCLLGARLGPVVVRHAPATPLRVLIGAAGVALAIKLAIEAYS